MVMQNVYNIFKDDVDTEYSGYNINNWNEYCQQFFNSLSLIHSNKAAIWLNAKGDLCYRLSYYDEKILTSTAKKISLVFSNFLQRDVVIGEKLNISTKEPIYINAYRDQILIHNLPFVKDEFFNPCETNEFVKRSDNFIYRNTFKPSSYLMIIPTTPYTCQPSIILQYIFYLACYKQGKFYYIMNWLAMFFKDLSNKSNIALVLIGNKISGKDILFDEIIQPLFGKDYSVKVNDVKLQTNNLASLLKNKLFYNLDDITSVATEEKRTKTVLKDIINNDTITIEERNSIEQLEKYGQTLITISEPYIPYINNKSNKHTVFKIPNNIEDIHIPEFFQCMSKLTAPFHLPLPPILLCSLSHRLKSHLHLSISNLLLRALRPGSYRIYLSQEDTLTHAGQG